MFQHLDHSLINIGDRVVHRGVNNVFPAGRRQAIVGTPWFWDKCSQSAKYQWLNGLLDAGDVTEAIGVGSCFPLGFDERMILDDPEESEALRATWSRFDKVVVRDSMAHALLNGLGVSNILLPCPSVFSIVGLDLRDPRPGSTVVIGAREWDEVLTFPEAQKFDTLHPDTTYLNYGYGCYTDVDVQDFLINLSQYENLVGRRVHAITPFSTVRSVSIEPVDSRHLTALNAGVGLHPSLSKPLGPHKLAEWRDAYLSYLT
jgi:hypothetical protein